ncbi:HPP family protein [Uliginosibacterium aquaticum]|uniref:HPP family protein n=1 Tax=Uliginosibacterium aquaticum TaxID=2731212 RepID=A0ABX2IKY4_9RHOO|nr:HPP family protein [Uliginosibacterium aquaticum]NSL55692.1 HPP family protein [Uliginosibacterium aquaticum]
MNTPQRPDGATAPAWWRAFLPARTPINARERLRTVVGGLLGIALTALLSHLASRVFGGAAVWLVAPMGASAVLVFAAPASPMAQPWAVVAGNTVSALVGIAVLLLTAGLGLPELTAGLAVAGAIAAMLALRCLHPPGGASALLMALNGISNPLFAFYPVLLNSVLLVAAGIAYNHATRRPYPHSQQTLPKPAEAGLDADLDAVLAHYNQVLDISRDDLKALLAETSLRSYQRQLAELRCSDVMSRTLITVEFGTPLQEAWSLLREKRIKALPVVDNFQRLVGIVTLADFMRAAELDDFEGMDSKLRQLLRPTPGPNSSKPEVVGQIMTRKVRVASEQRHLAELLPLFGSTGHHHIPIIGAGERLVGIITQSDLVTALSRAGQGAG